MFCLKLYLRLKIVFSSINLLKDTVKLHLQCFIIKNMINILQGSAPQQHYIRSRQIYFTRFACRPHYTEKSFRGPEFFENYCNN